MNEKIHKFTDLNAWKQSHALVLSVYEITKNFPKEEQYGLTSQLKRAAVSVTSNIAEGFSRNTYKDKIHFYTMALGSLTEVQNLFIVAKDIEYISLARYVEIENQLIITHKIINGLIKKSKSFSITS